MRTVLFLAFLALPPLARADLIQTTDFETGDLGQMQIQGAAADSVTLVTAPVRAGRYAAKTLLRASDPKVHKGQRAEFSDRRTEILMDKDYWYGLSIFIPGDFIAPTKGDAVLFQWHTQQSGPSPVLAIRVRNGEWFLTCDATDKRRALAKIPFERDRWTDWVVHVRWSAQRTGFWTIWKDGAEVVSERDIVTHYPEALGPYAKFGQYHSVGEAPQNIVYFDEYRVAGPGSRYEDVAPPRSPSPGERPLP